MYETNRLNRMIIFVFFSIIVFSCNDDNSNSENAEIFDLPAVNDSWDYNPAEDLRNVSFQEAEIDSAVIDSIHSEITAYQKNSADYRSFLVLNKRKLVFEQYYDGGNENELNSLKSVTKSVVGLLAGKAVELGLIESADQKIIDFFPDYFNDVESEMKKEITVKNLLTMSAGFQWNNFGGKYRSGWDVYEGNRHEYMITHTVMENEPGEIFNYNSGLSHMVSGIITNESGMSTAGFAEKYLFNSLGITNYKWTADRNGYHLGNSELFLTSRDMAKIGLLVLENGYWFDKQLFNSSWIEDMLDAHIETAGIGEKYSEHYGYYWWVKDYNGVRINFAAGYGGQYIFVIKDFDLVIVFTTNWQSSSVSFKPLGFVERIVDSYN